MIYVESIKLRQTILDRCKVERVPLTTIFMEECNRVLPHVAASITFKSIVSSMKRARSQSTPRIPQTYEEYVELLRGRFRDTDGTEYSFRKVGQDEDEAVCFIIDRLKDVLVNAEEIHIDGTFKVVPSIPRSRQLLTVIAVENDHALPVAFSLMKSKTAASYKNVFNYIKNECEGLQPKLIMSDFEASIKNAVNEVFPGAVHKGCWFHFTQAIFKRVQRSGQLNAYYANEEIKRCVRMLMALALLPQHFVEEGFNYVEVFCEEKEITVEMGEMLDYFQTQWLQNVGAASFSVYGQPRRTNNIQESFHHSLNNHIGKCHPNVWEFTDALCAIAGGAVRDHLRIVTRGANLAFGRRRRWVLQDRQILKAQENLVLGRATIREFLRQMTHHVASHAPLDTVHEDADMDVASLPDELRVHTVPEDDGEGEDDEPLPIALHHPRARGGRGGRRGRGGRGRANGRRGGGVEPVAQANEEPIVAVDVDGEDDEPLPIALHHQRARGGRGGRRGRGGRGRANGRRGGGVEPVAQANEEPIVAVDNDDPMPEQGIYSNYRNEPTFVVEDHFMSASDVQRQQQELRQSLTNVEQSTASTDQFTCCLCIVNRPTRLCIPCGHIVMCSECAVDFVHNEQFHTVTLADGNLLTTHIRLPLICPYCRAIIGSLARAVLPSIG